MKVDILYLAHNRRAFTAFTLACLKNHTCWSEVATLWLYDDMSDDGAEYLVAAFTPPPGVELRRIRAEFGSPVAVMRDYLRRPGRAEVFAKIDSDTAVPVGWLEVCIQVMQDHPRLDLLGIEALDDQAIPFGAATGARGFYESSWIGGIGLMRARAFRDSLPEIDRRFFGFTHWQNMNPQVQRGFLSPSLPVALLDHVPVEPWAGLARMYVERGFGRAWPPYGQHQEHLWKWIETA